MIYAIVAVVALAVGLAVGYFYRKNAMEKKIGQTEEFARNMLEEATRKAEDKKKEAVLAPMEQIRDGITVSRQETNVYEL